jgi:hypothetical protein
MPGPSPNRGLHTDGPPFTGPHPSHPIPASPASADAAGDETAPLAAAHPGPLPYPRPYRRRLIVGGAVAVALVAAMTAAIVYGARSRTVASGRTLTDTTAKTAIQGYLDALENRDTETIARNALCGIYDAVADRRTDRALAKLSSDAFRKQFSATHVTSIDKIVYWSEYQTQVLFTMRVTPTTGGPPRDNVQGIAQLLSQHNRVLVCSYVLRTAGTY